VTGSALRRAAAVVVLVAAFAGATAFRPPAATAQRLGDGDLSVVVLLDISSSMSEGDGTGTVKIDGARAAISKFLTGLPDTVQLGVRAFPAPGNSCGPGVRQVPVGHQDDDAVRGAIDALSPDGNTPTAEALKAAAEDFPQTQFQTIVVVSDGESNCGEDPCDAAREITRAGVEITVNTLGFQISDSGRDELECISEATKGRYRDVDDSSELARELVALTGAQLHVTLGTPSRVPVPATGTGEPFVVSATVNNVGGRDALDVTATLSFDEGSPVAVRDPRQRIGNVRAGERVDAAWNVPSPAQFEPTTVDYTVTAEAADGTRTRTRGSVLLTPPGFTLDERAGPLLGPVRHLVIMGDSYSSGEGAGSYVDGTDSKHNACHVSEKTYGLSAAGQPLFPRRTILACSGAVSADFHVPHPEFKAAPYHRTPLPAQLQALDDLADPPDAVWLTLGGNDVGFETVIFQCLAGIPGLVCDQVVRASAEEHVKARLPGLAGSLIDAYAGIHSIVNAPSAVEERGRAAPIVVLAYPKILPQDPTAQARCTALFSQREILWANRLTERLNDQVRRAVEILQPRGVPIYFSQSVERAFVDSRHTLCDEDAYVVSPGVLTTTLSARALQLLALPKAPLVSVMLEVMSPEEFRAYRQMLHPTADGYLAMTAAVLADSQGWRRPSQPLPALRSPGYQRVGTSASLLAGAKATLGRAYRVAASGFMAGSPVGVVLRSDPRLVGWGVADRRGRVEATVFLPNSAEPGTHALEVEGVDPEGEAHIVRRNVTLSPPGPAKWPWWLLGVGVVLTGGGSLTLRLVPRPTVRRRLRRRRDPGHAAPSAP
jgi:hypothetical protein